MPILVKNWQPSFISTEHVERDKCQSREELLCCITPAIWHLIQMSLPAANHLLKYSKPVWNRATNCSDLKRVAGTVYHLMMMLLPQYSFKCVQSALHTASPLTQINPHSRQQVYVVQSKKKKKKV